MMFQDNPFGQLPDFSHLAGPGGIAGSMGQQQMGGGLGSMMGMGGMGLMGGMFGPKKKQGGFNPLMLSPLAYAFSKDPKIGLAMLSPGIGIANLLGAFK